MADDPEKQQRIDKLKAEAQQALDRLKAVPKAVSPHEPPAGAQAFLDQVKRAQGGAMADGRTKVIGSSMPPPTPADITSPPNPQPSEKPRVVEEAVQEIRSRVQSMQESGALD